MPFFHEFHHLKIAFLDISRPLSESLEAISQTIEPLLSAYQAIHERQLAKSILAEAQHV